MKKSARITLIVLLLLAMSFNVLAVVLSDNDGAAFISKPEFDSLKSTFQSRLDEYNTSIDTKIDQAISSYLSGIIIDVNLDSVLNGISEDRRTFVNNISNPTTSRQDNLYISTDGFWAYYRKYDDGNFWEGWEVTGLNNCENGDIILGANQYDNLTHGSGLGNGKYVFVDPIDEEKTAFYINDKNLKDLKFRIWANGGEVKYRVDNIGSGSPTYYTIPSIDWSSVTYNYTATVARGCGRRPDGSIDTVKAAESIFLSIADYAEIPWVSNMSSGKMYEAETGTLTTENQYKWTNRVTDFALGYAGSQTYGAKYNSSYSHSQGINSNNIGTNEQTLLTFNTPKITMIPGNELLVYDVTNTLDEKVYYYSGLPICKMPYVGELTLKIKCEWSSAAGKGPTIIAISDKQFANSDIDTDMSSSLAFWKKYDSSDEGFDSGEFEIKIPREKLKNTKNKYIWIKAKNTGADDCAVKVSTDGIKLKYTASN